MKRTGVSKIILCSVVLLGLGLLVARVAGEGHAAPGGRSTFQGVIPSNADNIEILGNFGGSAQTIVVQGNFVYLGMGLSMDILDISDPTHPTLTGKVTLAGNAQDIAIAYPYAYVVAGGGLWIIDVSDPHTPATVGYYTHTFDPLSDETVEAPVAVAVDGNYVYVTFGGGWYGEFGSLRVVDVSDLTQPVEVGAYISPAAANDIVLSEGYAYLAIHGYGLRVLDVSNPTQPMEVGVYDSPYQVGDKIAKTGDIIVLAGYQWLQTVIVSDPSAPIEAGSLNVNANGLAVDANYVYYTNTNQLWILDISNPYNIAFFNSYDYFKDEPHGVAIQGGFAFVADNLLGLRVINTTTDELTEVGFFDMPDRFQNMVTEGNYAYLIHPTDIEYSNDRASIWDIANPAMPREISSYDLQGFNHAMALSGSNLFITDGYVIRVVDYSNPISPTQISLFDPVWHMRGIAIEGHYAYVMSFDDQWSNVGLRVVDISDPTNLVEVGFYRIDEPIYGPMYFFLVSNGFAYIFHYDKMDIVNLSDPANPVEVGSYPTIREALVADVVGDMMYLLCSDSYLHIIDVSNPAQPIEKANMSGGFGSVMVVDDFAYVGSGEGLHVIDVSNPENPIEVGFYHLPGMSGEAVRVGSTIYMSTNGSGILIFRFTGLSIDGQVFQTNRLPVAGVTLSKTSALTATTNLTGDYTFGELARGTYTVTPSLPGYTFRPVSLSLTLPPNGVHQDFTILPLPVTVTLTPGMTTTLTLTDTQGLTTTLFFPAGAVTETVSLTLTPTSGTSQLSWVFAGHAFDLAVSHEGVLLPDFTFSVPVTVTIHYSNVDVRLVRDEGQLTLWEWVGNTWQDAVQICDPLEGYNHDEVDNVVSLGICRTGNFKLMGPTYPVFLPVITMP
jgi:hypothetical protein